MKFEIRVGVFGAILLLAVIGDIIVTIIRAIKA